MKKTATINKCLPITYNPEVRKSLLLILNPHNRWLPSDISMLEKSMLEHGEVKSGNVKVVADLLLQICSRGSIISTVVYTKYSGESKRGVKGVESIVPVICCS